MHRHALEFVSLSECGLDEDGNVFIPKRFRFCAVCQRVPDAIVGDDPINSSQASTSEARPAIP